MLTSSEIINICAKEGLSAHETYFCFDEEIDVCLRSGDICELISIAKQNCVNTMFYAFQYCNESEYLITDEDLLEEDEYKGFEHIYASYRLRFKKKMISFNSGIDRRKLVEPNSLCVYLLMAGLQVGIVQYNDYFSQVPDKRSILNDLYEILEQECQNEEDRFREKEEELRKKGTKQIIDYIDTTDEWKTCTNQQLRRAYCQKLADDYRLRNGVRIYPSELFLELEKRWVKYKDAKKNVK